MLEWKKNPQNIRALRLLTEELLRPVIVNNQLNNMAGLEEVLVYLSSKIRTTKAWTDLVIKPTLLIMQFTRATHEPDYALLIYKMNKMFPYFFSDHKHNYALYGLSSVALWHDPHLKSSSNSLMWSRFSITWKGCGMVFHLINSLKIPEWSEQRARLALLETHKNHKRWQHGHTVSSSWDTYRECKWW